MRIWPTKWLWTLYKWKKKSFGLWGSWYSNRPAQTHGFNAKIVFEKYAPSPKILPKKCPKSAFQTKPAKFDTFWPISQDSVHIFQNRFLRWNREFEPVDLNTINPIIRTIFFSLIKGSEPFCRPFPHRKMALIRIFESRSLFSIYIYKFSDYRQYQFQIFVFFTAPY